MNSLTKNIESENNFHNAISLLILVGLLVLRIPLLGFVTFIQNEESVWVVPIYEIGTYLFTAFLIWWERDRLDKFHIDRLVITLIIIARPLQTLLEPIINQEGTILAFPKWGSIVIWIVAIFLLLGLRRSKPNLPKLQRSNWRNVLIGIGIGIIAAIIGGYLNSFQINIDSSELEYSRDLLWFLQLPIFIVFQFIYQLGYSAVNEEPLFRGFLWGYLRNAGWRNFWIWLFQAGIFMLSHIYFIESNPISFWIIIPGMALILGILAWRSHTIAASMAAHATYNSLAFTIGYFIALYR